MRLIISPLMLFVMTVAVVNANECDLISECTPIADCPLIRDYFNLIKRKPYCNLDRPGANVCCRKSSQNYAQPKYVDFPFVRECKSYDSSPSLQNPLGKGCNHTSDIVRRVKAEPKEFPFMALVHPKVRGKVGNYCGGVLISKKYVLTSAFCFFSHYLRPNWVRLGELDYNSNLDDALPQDIEIKNFIPHPQYRATKRTHYHDIALIELAKEATFNDYVRPACLSLGDDNDFQQFLSAGWGYPPSEPSSHLRRVKLNRLDFDKCFEKVTREDFEEGINNRTNMCGIPSTGGIGNCAGDGGGPVFVTHPEFPCQFLIVGIMSHTNDCGLNSECRPVADCPLIRDNFNLIKRKPYCNLDRPGAHVCCRRSSQNSTQPTNVDLRVVRECRSYDSLPSVQRPLGEGCNYISNFIGRANAEPKEFPFTALVFNENPKGVANKLCGGVLISKKYVLTSVYCFVYDGFRPNWVRVGELDFGTTMEDASPQIIEIKNFIPHHQFRASELTIYHDIALVELAEEAVFDDYVRPACLSLEDGNDYQEFLSAGWDYPLPGHSSHLHKTKVNRLDDDKCYEKVRRKHLEKGINSRTHMCAIPSTGNISTCPGNGECKSYDNLPSLQNPLEEGCNYTSNFVGRVEAEAKEFPFMALIYGKSGDVPSKLCTGTLISKKYVLTAAHCSFVTNPRFTFVRLGELDYATNADDALLQDIEIKNLIPHPQYYRTPLTFYHDIALIELAKEATFNDYVRPACLSLEDGNDYHEFLAAGWGYPPSTPSTHLQCRSYDSLPSLQNPLGEECRYTSNFVGRVEAESKEFPFMAVVHNKNGNKVGEYCSGVLISKKYVLTTATPLTWVLLGDLDFDINTDDALPQDIKIKKFIPHPQYRATKLTLYHDIGLIELAKEAIFSDYVRPACLSLTDDNDFQQFLSAGWGRRNKTPPSGSHPLHKVKLNRLDFDKCFEKLAREDFEEGINNRTNMCAIPSTGDIGSCVGDTGGPVFVTHPEFPCQFLILDSVVSRIHRTLIQDGRWQGNNQLSAVFDDRRSNEIILQFIDAMCNDHHGPNECGPNSECVPIADCPVIRDNFNLIKRKPYCNLDRPGAHVCCRKSSQSFTQSKNVDLRVVRECRSYDSLPGLQNRLEEGCNCTSNTVGRVKAEPKELPFIALIHAKRGNFVAKLCTGTLISKKYVLTTAHCFFATNIPITWVRLGELDYLTNTNDALPQDIEIKNVITHHQYHASGVAVHHNIALVELAKEAVFNDYVRPACLSPADGNDYQEFLGAGWGYPPLKPSSHLNKMKLNRLDFDKCAEIIQGGRPGKGINNRANMCMIPSTSNISTCGGDGGGPLFVTHPEFPCQFLVIGIVSFANDCGLNSECRPVADCPLIRDNFNLIKRKPYCNLDRPGAHVCCRRSSQNSTQPTNVDFRVVRECRSYDSIPSLQNPPEEECRYTSNVVGRIKAEPKEFPFMALIYSKKGDLIDRICGGTLISKKYVLTSASTFRNSDHLANWVRLGDLDHDTYTDDALTQDIKTKNYIPHPQYYTSKQTFYHDIALIELATEAVFNDYVRPACLSPIDANGFQEFLAAGWGFDPSEPSTHLHKVKLDRLDDDKCFESIKRDPSEKGINNRTNMCVIPSTGGKGTCNGDGGGPLFLNHPDFPCQFLVVGVLSYGQSICGTGDYPSVFTRVKLYIDWIERISMDAMCNDEYDRNECAPKSECIAIADCPLIRDNFNLIKRKPYCNLDRPGAHVCCRRSSQNSTQPKYVDFRVVRECRSYDSVPSLQNPLGAACNYTSNFVGRVEAESKEFPFMAIMYNKRGEKDGRICTGALISKKYVLTSAYCFLVSRPALSWVRLGELDYTTNTDDALPQDIAIKNFIPHRHYNSTRLIKYHDIALIEMANEAVLNDYVRPACLSLLDGNDFEQFLAAGWGYPLSEPSSHLHKVKLDRLDDDICFGKVRRHHLERGINNRTNICAMGACEGGGGSPLFVNHPEFPCQFLIVANECALSSECIPIADCPFIRDNFSLIKRKPYCNLDRPGAHVCCRKPSQNLTQSKYVDLPIVRANGCALNSECIPIADCPFVRDNFNLIKRKPYCNLDRPGAHVCCRTSSQPKIVDLSIVRECRFYDSLPNLKDPAKEGCQYIHSGNISKSNIIGRVKAEAREFPFIALIYAVKEGTAGQFCSGTLISRKYVLTSAFCCLSGHLRPSRVRLGDLDYGTHTDDAVLQDYEIRNIIPHHEYQSTILSKYNNIALIEMEKEAIFNDYVRPACLSLIDDNDFRQFMSAGWGYPPSEPTSHLHKVKLDRLDDDKCFGKVKRSHLEKGINNRTNMCAIGACDAGGGSPLFVNHPEFPCQFLIVGVMSFAHEICGSINDPTVYTRIKLYVDWIQRVVWN
uniref:Peptidase S1 domain-containing protein n=1 Tax=Glossina pallidipes TaxID=7398 RepID=A0A1A9ZHN4_GLOPL